MELHLVVHAKPGDKDTEMLNGTNWCVKGPLDIHDANRLKYHCVSYVWGFGREKVGGLFNSQIEISDQTRPALEAAIRAVEAAQWKGEGPIVRAFWIDAICVPQKDGPEREATLERFVLRLSDVKDEADSSKYGLHLQRRDIRHCRSSRTYLESDQVSIIS